MPYIQEARVMQLMKTHFQGCALLKDFFPSGPKSFLQEAEELERLARVATKPAYASYKLTMSEFVHFIGRRRECFQSLFSCCPLLVLMLSLCCLSVGAQMTAWQRLDMTP